MTGTGQDLTAGPAWDQAVRRHGPRRFLRAPGHDLSYAEFDRWTGAAAAARLAAAGIRAGHPVALVLGSTPAHLARPTRGRSCSPRAARRGRAGW